MFVTSGSKVDVWQEGRSEPVRSFSWGVDSVHYVKFNPVEVRSGQRKGQNLSAVLAGGGAYPLC